MAGASPYAGGFGRPGCREPGRAASRPSGFHPSRIAAFAAKMNGPVQPVQPLLSFVQGCRPLRSRLSPSGERAKGRESVRNVAVAAVNPPGHSVSVPFAPCRFSRRGPDLRAGVKPDLAHVGGSGSPKPPLDHALFSVTPDGAIISGCGTSYLTRAGEKMPDDGVPFTAILTISDPEGAQPVFNDLRQILMALGVQIADIHTAARITPRV